MFSDNPTKPKRVLSYPDLKEKKGIAWSRARLPHGQFRSIPQTREAGRGNCRVGRG